MISIKKYNYKLQYVWDDFIEKSNNGTIFHKQTFLKYHINQKIQNHSLMFYNKNNLIGVLPAAIIIQNNKKIFFSHPGASYGGLIYNKLSFNLVQKIIDCLHEYCIKQSVVECLLIQTPWIYHKHYNASFEYLLSLNGYAVNERYISHYLTLVKNKNPLLYIQKRKQRYIKSTFLNNSNYLFDESNKLSDFYKILLENKKKFNTTPTHSLKELEYLLKKFNNQIKLFMTSSKQTILGGILLFFTTKDTCLIFYNAVSEHTDSKNISLYQIYRCIEHCINNNFKIIDFGVSHLPNEKNPLLPKLSLIKFKEQFGCEGAIRKVYKKTITKNEQ